jgi:hypothetical protein
MSKINGIDASLITGLGGIGVGNGSAPTLVTSPTGGLITNTGFFGVPANNVPFSVNGKYANQPPFYDRPVYGDEASSASVWTKISGNGNSVIYCLSSSGELFSAGNAYNTTGRSSAGFVAGRLDKVTGVTPTSSWTDISVGGNYVVGINDGYLWGTGAPTQGEYGSGSATYSDLGVWRQISTNQGWVRVETGANFTVFMSGSSKASGSVWISGANGNGRTGMNTTSGNTSNRSQPFGFTGSIWTDAALHTIGYTLLISESGHIYSTGINTNYNGGTGNTTQRTTFILASSASTFTKVFNSTAHSRAIDTNGHHYYVGNQSSGRGDGVVSSTLTRFTRITGSLSDGWQNFYSSNNVGFWPGTIGINNNRPYFIQSTGNTYAAIMPAIDKPWQSSSYAPGAVAVSTWAPFISGSGNLNITCSAIGLTNYNSLQSPYLPALWMYLEPQ